MRISDWSSDGCSSDLFARHGGRIAIASRKEEHRAAGVAAIEALGGTAIGVALDIRDPEQVTRAFDEIEARSEEHTSELQSLMRISYAVFCLKKKKKKDTINTQYTSHKYTIKKPERTQNKWKLT